MCDHSSISFCHYVINGGHVYPLYYMLNLCAIDMIPGHVMQIYFNYALCPKKMMK